MHSSQLGGFNGCSAREKSPSPTLEENGLRGLFAGKGVGLKCDGCVKGLGSFDHMKKVPWD